MDADREEIELLIDEADGQMDLNPVEFMQPGNSERMNRLQDELDKSCISCVVKLKKWRRDHASILDATLETALQTSVAKMKQDVLAYKRDLMPKQRDFPAAPTPTPGNRSGSRPDPLTKHFRHEAKAKMLALHNQVKICCEGIQSDAQLDELGTGWEDAEDDEIRKAMRDKERWISGTIQLQSDLSSY